MSQRHFFGPPCTQCRIKRYYQADGQTYCERGHYQEGIFELVNEDEEGGAGAFGRRRKRVNTQGQFVTQLKPTTILYGKAGYAVYLQAFQLVLRLQGQSIAKKLHLPEFEPVLKDLWHLFLRAQNADERLPDLFTEEALTGHSVLDQEEDMETTQLELNSQVSSREASPEVTVYSHAYYTMKKPLLIHSVALCYLSLLLLRVPITFVELRKWIISGDLPYMRVIKKLPSEMTKVLETHYCEAFDPQLRPRCSRLFKWTQHTAIFLSMSTFVVFPPVNHPPILLHIVRDLYLPLAVFNGAIKVISLLNLTFTLSRGEREGRGSSAKLSPLGRLYAVVCVVAKLLYNLDQVSRSGKSLSEPINDLPDPGAWHKHIVNEISRREGVETASKIKVDDVFEMDADALDRYLDWFRETWPMDHFSSKSAQTRMPVEIIGMFPIEGAKSQPSDPKGKSRRESEVCRKNEMEMEARSLDIIQALYRKEPGKSKKAKTRMGEQVLVTDLTLPAVKGIFDDLIELAALQSHNSNLDIRRTINWFEIKLSQISTRDLGLPEVDLN